MNEKFQCAAVYWVGMGWGRGMVGTGCIRIPGTPYDWMMEMGHLGTDWSWGNHMNLIGVIKAENEMNILIRLFGTTPTKLRNNTSFAALPM